jgi:hypothetical protein
MDVEKLAEMIDEPAWVARHLSGSAYPAGEPSALGRLLVPLERPGLFPEPATTFTARSPARFVAMEVLADYKRHRTTKRGMPPPDQDPDGASLPGDRSDAALGTSRIQSDPDAQD